MAPKLGDRPIVMIEQGGTAEATFDAADRMIHCMTQLAPKHKLYKNMGGINIYREFKVLAFKAPIGFLSIVGFLPLMKGCYYVKISDYTG